MYASAVSLFLHPPHEHSTLTTAPARQPHAGPDTPT